PHSFQLLRRAPANGSDLPIAVHFASPSLLIARTGFEKVHTSEFLQINSDGFRLAQCLMKEHPFRRESRVWAKGRKLRYDPTTWNLATRPTNRTAGRFRSALVSRDEFTSEFRFGILGVAECSRFPPFVR